MNVIYLIEKIVCVYLHTDKHWPLIQGQTEAILQVELDQTRGVNSKGQRAEMHSTELLYIT